MCEIIVEGRFGGISLCSNILSKWYTKIRTYETITIKLKYTYSPISPRSHDLWSTTLAKSYSGLKHPCIGEGRFVVGSVKRLVGVHSPTFMFNMFFIK